jgi:hypothetical protein
MAAQCLSTWVATPNRAAASPMESEFDFMLT